MKTVFECEWAKTAIDESGKPVLYAHTQFEDRGDELYLAPVGLHELAQAMTVELDRLQEAIRKHRDFRGDDRCWEDDEELYKTLPEGYEPPAIDSAVELSNCQRFIECRRNPATEYVSPQRRIEELQATNAALQKELDFLHSQFQLHSPQMNGEHSWHFRTGWPWTHAKGPDIQTAIVRAMAEVERSKLAARESESE